MLCVVVQLVGAGEGAVSRDGRPVERHPGPEYELHAHQQHERASLKQQSGSERGQLDDGGQRHSQLRLELQLQ
jgi:hypothetical protein